MLSDTKRNDDALMKIISVHFPKSGGTSLRIQFERILGTSMLLDYDHDPLGPHSAQTVDQLPCNIRMVHGHFRAVRYQKIRDAFRFTFLRHPVDNLLSIYFFWKTYPESDNFWHSKFLREGPTIEAFAKYGPLQRLMSESYFGGYDMSHFDFVGFHETRAADIAKLSMKIGLPLDATIHVNRTNNNSETRAEIENDPRVIGRLSSLLVDDVRFFERQRAVRN
jgi:hypothetical protein